LVIGPAGGARGTYLKEMFEYKPRRPHNWGADEPVVTALARIERGSDEERAAKATRRLAACGLSSVPSWMRPYGCLSNGEAARADVAAALAVHENNKEQYRVINDFACVVNRDAAMSMACAIGKYARRAGLKGLVLATAHEACANWLQPDWVYDVAADKTLVRPGPAARPKITFECDWSGCWTKGWTTPKEEDRRGMRNTDLVREVASTYALAPDAIERIVLGDGALPKPVTTRVRMNVVAVKASQAFDFEFDGNSTFTPPDFPRTKLGQDWGIGVVHGPSGSGKTTVLRQLFGGADGKVATAVPDWNEDIPVLAAFTDKFFHGDPIGRLNACALSGEERRTRISRLSACARARAQVAWLLADDVVLDEFTSLAPRRLAWEVARGVSEYVQNNGLKRVVVASVHEDVVAHLKPRWLFPTAVVSPCWKLIGNSKGGDKFGAAGDARYGCLALLHDVAAPRSPPTADRDLFAPPEITLQLARAPYYHYTTFEKHHYLQASTFSKGACCFEVCWNGRPVGFHATIPHFGLAGAGKGTSGAVREHRVVVLPDFQGIGLGWMMSEVMGERNVRFGRRFTSLTMHYTFGAGRDRSERWRPCPRNHEADKHEAVHDLVRRELQAAGTWVPKERDRLRYQYRHEYVGEGAVRAEYLKKASRNIPKHTCKGKGCGHCVSNYDVVRLRLAAKLSKRELEGTLWGSPRAAPLGTPAPTTVERKKREPRALTEKLEAVTVVGGRIALVDGLSPAERTAAQRKEDKAQKKSTAVAGAAKKPKAPGAKKRKAPAKSAAKRRKPRYEDDDDDEAFTASAPARASGTRGRSARATAPRGSLCEASDDEDDDELVELDEPAAAPAPPPPKRERTAPQKEFRKGQRVDAKFGRWYRATVDEVIRDAAGKITKYEIRWSNGDSNPIARGNVREPVAGTEVG